MRTHLIAGANRDQTTDRPEKRIKILTQPIQIFDVTRIEPSVTRIIIIGNSMPNAGVDMSEENNLNDQFNKT